MSELEKMRYDFLMKMHIECSEIISGLNSSIRKVKDKQDDISISMREILQKEEQEKDNESN